MNGGEAATALARANNVIQDYDPNRYNQSRTEWLADLPRQIGMAKWTWTLPAGLTQSLSRERSAGERA